MIGVDVDVERLAETVRGREEVFAEISDVPRLAALMPSVRRCIPLNGRWRWEFGEYGAFGLHVTPAFDIEASFDPPEAVRFRPVGDVTQGATGEGVVMLLATPTGTRIRAGLRLRVELTAPALLARPLRGVITREVRQIIDGLVDRLVVGPS